MSWSDFVITNNGLAYITRSIAGEELTVTKAGVGTGTVSAATLMAQTALSSIADIPVMIAGKNVSANSLDILIQILNTDVSESVRIKQIGIFAKIGTAPEILLAIMQDTIGEEIPSETEYPDFLLEMTAVLGISQSDNITVEISPSAVITKSTLEQELAKKANISDTAVLSVAQRTEISSPADLDSYVTAGPYWARSADGIYNSPWSDIGYNLDVCYISATTVQQRATAYDGRQKVRYKLGNENWSDWIFTNENEFSKQGHTHTKSEITDFPDLNPFVLVTKSEFEALVESGQDSRDTYYIITDVDVGTLEEGGIATLAGSTDLDTFIAEVAE